MNTLSWLILSADYAERLQVTAYAVAGVSCAVAAVSRLTGGFHRDITRIYADSSYPEGRKEFAEAKAKAEGAMSLIRPALTAAAVAAAIGVIAPSKSTFYAIAASEVGEEVIKSPTATKAVKALDAWLDKQIAGSPQ